MSALADAIRQADEALELVRNGTKDHYGAAAAMKLALEALLGAVKGATAATSERGAPVEPIVLDGFGDPILNGETYLISDDRSRDTVIWWNPKSAGYTGSVDRAGRYSGAEAARICRRCRSEVATNLFDNPTAWPVERISDDLVLRVVDSGVLLAAARGGTVPRE